MLTAARILLFLAGLVVAFLTSWIFLPPPNRTLLALAVGAPELSAWLVVGGLLLCLVTISVGGRGGLAQATFGLAAVATVLASVPLARLPFVARRFDGANPGRAIRCS